MTSEGRVVPRPLERLACIECGYGFHASPPTVAERDEVYDDRYDLGHRDVEADRRRALGYLEQIERFLETNGIPLPVGASVAEFGCGTGALLGFMADRWKLGRAVGIEPASRLVASAREHAHGPMEIVEGYAEQADIGTGYPLIVSVNVVEHALEPGQFLAAARAAIDPGGAIVIVCPDGAAPGSELLFRDHISSFSVDSFSRLAARAGLQVTATRALDGQQSGFRIYLVAPGTPAPGQTDECPARALARARDAYLAAWATMERAGLSELAGRRYAIFGVGEYCDLLNAYCPLLVDEAQMFVVDNPLQTERAGRPVLSVEQFMEKESVPVLAAVHPRNWAALKRRFDGLRRQAFHPYQFTTLRSKL